MVEPSTVVPNLKSDAPFFDALRGTNPYCGETSGSALPLEDMRGSYVLCPVRSTSLTYAAIDVDDLKPINDWGGHARGDATLKAVAASLVRSSRAGDVARANRRR